MAAAAHTPGGFGGVPQGVGKEFNSADAKTGILRKKKKKNQKDPEPTAEAIPPQNPQGVMRNGGF
jgi:hypothetical protein